MYGLKLQSIALVARPSLLLAVLIFPLVHIADAETSLQLAVRCAAVYATAFQLPVELVDAVIQVESDWNPYAVSSKGAEGLMQLMPATAIRFGVEDRFNIEENVRGGVAYLAWLIRLFRGDLRLAVAAYQVGESHILSRGLAYSSPDVFRYVSRVAHVYRLMRRDSAESIAMNCNRTPCWSER